MNKFKVLLIFAAIILLAGTSVLSAQSMDILDAFLAQDTAKFGETVYMIAVGSGSVDESASISEAMETAMADRWIKKGTDAGDPINLGELSYATMQAFDISGGIMYMLFPSPRYAVRELAYLDFISGQAHPGKSVSGEDALNIISAAAAYKEAE